MAKDYPIEPERELYTLKQAANILQVSPRTMWSWITKGKVQAFKVDLGWRITREEIQRIKGVTPETQAETPDTPYGDV